METLPEDGECEVFSEWHWQDSTGKKHVAVCEEFVEEIRHQMLVNNKYVAWSYTATFEKGE